MTTPITSEIVVAYAHCPRKAFLLLCSNERGLPHEYVEVLEHQKHVNQVRYRTTIHGDQRAATRYDLTDLRSGRACLVGTALQVPGLEAECAVLTKVPGHSSLGAFHYDPTILAGTYTVTRDDKIRLAFAGLALAHLQATLPKAGKVVGMDEQVHTLDLSASYKDLTPLLAPVQQWAAASPAEPPPVILNKHCPLCPFRALCRAKAEQDDDLTLLDHMTPKALRRYHRKGIFTITQLSYLFRPRKRRKQQLIKLAQEMVGLGSARVRAPRLELEGRELEEARHLIGHALDCQPAISV